MPTKTSPPTLVTLPPEVRNQIYAYLFVSPVNDPIPPVPEVASPIAKALRLEDPRDSSPPPCSPDFEHDSTTTTQPTRSTLSLLLTSHLLHHETSLLHLTTQTFHLHSTNAEPPQFALQTSNLSKPQLSALKHLTLTARITQLRALNETWNGHPFGHPDLHLETLTLVPRRPDAGNTAWAEVAELDQCHTLAHVLAETLKTLGSVEEVRVVNKCSSEGAPCFGEGVWRLVYRHLVFKVWRWGGTNCGIRFECSGEEEDKEGGGWFKAFLGKAGGEEGDDGCKGKDAGVEAYRLLGASADAVAAMP